MRVEISVFSLLLYRRVLFAWAWVVPGSAPSAGATRAGMHENDTIPGERASSSSA